LEAVEVAARCAGVLVFSTDGPPCAVIGLVLILTRMWGSLSVKQLCSKRDSISPPRESQVVGVREGKVGDKSSWRPLYCYLQA
jgi:hypothetical protein